MSRPMTAILVAVGLSLAGLGIAAPVSADGVWHQAYGRTSAEAACPAPSDETAWQDSFTGQREWTPSWEGWMNGGAGGWVCQRTIVWLRPAPTGPGCQFVDSELGADYYADFGSSTALRSGPRYEDPSCATTASGSWQHLLYAPGIDTPTAIERCLAAFDVGRGAYQMFTNPDVWDCDAA